MVKSLAFETLDGLLRLGNPTCHLCTVEARQDDWKCFKGDWGENRGMVGVKYDAWLQD